MDEHGCEARERVWSREEGHEEIDIPYGLRSAQGSVELFLWLKGKSEYLVPGTQ